MQLIVEFQSYAELKVKLLEIINRDQIDKDNNRVENSTPAISKTPFRKNKRWTQYEIDQVTNWYTNKTYTAKEMGKALGRTGTSVSQLISKLIGKGLRPRGNRAGKAVEN